MPTLVKSPAPSSDLWLPRSPKSALFARRHLEQFLNTIADGHRLIETGELLVSELVTNAVVHGTREGRLVWLSLRFRADGRLRVEVHDSSSRLPVQQQAEHRDSHGRGLFLVNSLADDWGSHPRPCGIGKIVWCVISPEGSREA
ncbi:ATP-binding protein [Kitasatospora mediocidica]|uniref:ATP-binding protein n=1 Tax=Kitasatospora mediocidica TaxID=58352 RepID=UPI000A02B4B9|nr:ATP-binding protein [Kitasatospora mediocidica]